MLPASSSAPKYKFVVPNEYVYKFMKHLVERPFHMRDMSGKLWDCVLIQRKNKASLGRASAACMCGEELHPGRTVPPSWKPTPVGHPEDGTLPCSRLSHLAHAHGTTWLERCTSHAHPLPSTLHTATANPDLPAGRLPARLPAGEVRVHDPGVASVWRGHGRAGGRHGDD